MQVEMRDKLIVQSNSCQQQWNVDTGHDTGIMQRWFNSGSSYEFLAVSTAF